MAVFKFNADTPQIDSSAWIAHDANIIGNVEVCKKASVWFGATLRGDNEKILVGHGSNIPVSYTHLTLPTIPGV